jgi:hypothetical protein
MRQGARRSSMGVNPRAVPQSMHRWPFCMCHRSSFDLSNVTQYSNQGVPLSAICVGAARCFPKAGDREVVEV